MPSEKTAGTKRQTSTRKSFYGRERIGESNYHDSQGEFWPKLKQCLTEWTKEALPQSFRTRAFWLFPAFVLRHFLSHCCATSSRSLSDPELSAGEVPLDLAEFCHVVALAPLQPLPCFIMFALTQKIWLVLFVTKQYQQFCVRTGGDALMKLPCSGLLRSVEEGLCYLRKWRRGELLLFILN